MVYDLGEFRPKLTTVRGVTRAWRNFVRAHFDDLPREAEVVPAWHDYEVRDPNWHNTTRLGIGDQHLHQDLRDGYDFWMVVWASEMPTLVARRDPLSKWYEDKAVGEFAVTYPWHVYAFKNHEYMHARPQLSADHQRWFCRHYVTTSHALVLNSTEIKKEK